MGVRTPDLLNAIQALYQLSYDPVKEWAQTILRVALAVKEKSRIPLLWRNKTLLRHIGL